jgi:hypothetical protein
VPAKTVQRTANRRVPENASIAGDEFSKPLKEDSRHPGLYGQECNSRFPTAQLEGDTNMKTLIAAALVLTAGVSPGQLVRL